MVRQAHHDIQRDMMIRVILSLTKYGTGLAIFCFGPHLLLYFSWLTFLSTPAYRQAGGGARKTQLLLKIATYARLYDGLKVLELNRYENTLRIRLVSVKSDRFTAADMRP